MTLKQAKTEAKLVQCSLNKTQFGDYRVNPYSWPEKTAYYTHDLQDAVDTAKAYNLDNPSRDYYS